MRRNDNKKRDVKEVNMYINKKDILMLAINIFSFKEASFSVEFYFLQKIDVITHRIEE